MNWTATVTFLLLVYSVNGQHSKCFSGETSLPNSHRNVTDLQNEVDDFSISLFKTLYYPRTGSNFFFSPYSVWNCLVLAYFGANGNTKQELETTLKLPGKWSTLMLWRSMEYRYSTRRLNSNHITSNNATQPYVLRLANRIYFDKSIPVLKCIKEVMHNELALLDMKHRSRKSARLINGWVEQTTNKRIKDLISQHEVYNSVMILINAAYFKGTWKYMFKEASTTKSYFYTTRQIYSFVHMMTLTAKLKTGYSVELKAQILQLPYNGDSISMYIFLPPLSDNYDEFNFNFMLRSLNLKTFKSAISNIWSEEITVSLPKFSMDVTIKDELIWGLNTMGINDLFDSNKANLSDFSNTHKLSVSRAVHKAFVEVTEEGTEAAAVTALFGHRSSFNIPALFNCNHPFAFVIYDDEVKNILFMGVYIKPK